MALLNLGVRNAMQASMERLTWSATLRASKTMLLSWRVGSPLLHLHATLATMI